MFSCLFKGNFFSHRQILVLRKINLALHGEFSPVPLNSVRVTDFNNEIPVSETDMVENADSSQVFATPTKSTTVCPVDSIATKVITPPVSNQVALQSAETKLSFHSCAVNQSDHSFESVPVSSNACQSTESQSICSSPCDSGIVSILDQTSQQPSPTKTLLSLSENDISSSNQIFTSIPSISELSQIKTGEECSKQVVHVYTHTSSHHSIVVEHTENRGRNRSPLPLQSTPIITLGHSITSLPNKALSGGTSQFAVSPVKSFEQVKQSDGHKEYGRLHPVRRPWKLMYLTLRWLKPFK